MKKIIPFIVSGILIACTACDPPSPTIPYGVYGTVTQREGNWMPPVNPQEAHEFPIQCEIAAFDSINIADLGNSLFQERIAISDFNIREVTRTSSALNGFYMMKLPAGKYSIGVVDGDSILTHSMRVADDGGWLMPLELFSNELREFNIVVDYAVH